MSPSEARAAWVEALRSGEFKQGRGRLHDIENDTYCCLGVACVLGEREGVIRPGEPGLAFERAATLWENDAYGLSHVMREWLKLPSDDEDILVARNDDGFSFEEIADMIEALDSRDHIN